MIYTTVKKIDSECIEYKQCDCCHKKYFSDDLEHLSEWMEFIHIRFNCGRGSIFGEGLDIECDLCQHCVKELLGKYLQIDSSWGNSLESEDVVEQ